MGSGGSGIPEASILSNIVRDGAALKTIVYPRY